MSPRRLAVFAISLALVACAAGLSGRYELQSIDGDPLPVSFFFDSLTAADIQLHGDGSCRATVFFASDDPPEVDDECSWSAEGLALTVVLGDAETLSGSVVGSTFTATGDDGDVYVFQRR